jgi:RHS repeat-associated protein
MLQQVRDPTYTLALSLSYDAKGRLRTHTDLDGGTYSYAYDAWGKLSADTLPLIGAEGVYQRPVVGFASLEAAVLPPAGMGTSGNPAPRVVPDSVRQRITDPRGYVTRIAVDRFGLPTRVEEPLGRTTVTSRNRHGLPEQVVEPGGVVTAYAYDDQTGNVTQAVNWETGSAVTYEYDPATHLPVRVSMGSVDLHYSYTAAGALQSLRVGTDTTFYTSDARGRVRTVTDAAKRVASMAYDPAGFQNTVSMVSPSPAGGTHTVEYVHDGYGRTVRTRSSAGDSAVVSLDSLNRVRFAVDAAGDTVTNTWSGTRLYQVRDAAGKVYTFNTNRLGWLDSEVDPQGRIRHWAYDRAGNLIGHKNHRAQVTGYAYDALGRPTFVDADVDRWFAYDPLGRWEAGWNAESRDTLFFDRLGRLERQVTVMGGRRYELRSTWRTEGVRSNLDVLSPWQRSAAWGYGPSMHLTSVSDFGGGTTQLSQYNRVGQPGRATFPGGTLLQQFAYDTASGRPAASTWSPATANSLTRSYVFDARGLLSSRHGAGRHQGYEYDAVGQLTQHADWTMTLQLVCEDEQRLNCHSEVSLDTTAVQGYAYDPVGNRTDAGASLEAGTNRYGAFNGWTLQYDLDGNLTAKTAAGSAGGSYQYTWDSEGQLTGSNLNGIGWVSYGYNAFGQRVRRTSPVGAVQRYLYDGDDLLMELDAAGDPVREYTYYPGVDLPHSVRQNGQTYYYALEYPGHVAGLVTAAGQVVNRYEYTPFGKTLSMTEGVPNPLQYMARELDSDAGLYYVRNRWYDPALERFVSEDPIGLAGGPNLYGYAGNSPTNLRDPSGLCVTGWYSVSAYHVDLGGHVDLGRAYVLCTLYSRQAAEAMEAAAAGFREMYAHPNPGPAVAAGGTGQQAPADWKSCALSLADASMGVLSDATLFSGVGLVYKGARGAMAARASMAAVRSGAIRVGRGRVIRQYPQLMKGARAMMSRGTMEAGTA